MDRASFIQHIRFLFHDTSSSNYIRGEPLNIRPENVVDGVNKLFYLANKRIAAFESFKNRFGQVIPATDYTVDLNTGEVVFTGDAPPDPYKASYYWYKLSDDEINMAIRVAMAAGRFNPDTIAEHELDYAASYCLAYCYQSAASRASEYYTLSAAGKQVSKSELFNHYMSMYQTLLTQAKELRSDQKTDRGSRDEPAAEDATSDWSKPYLLDSGGG